MVIMVKYGFTRNCGEEWGMLYGRKRLKDDNGNWVYYASGNHRYENNQF